MLINNSSSNFLKKGILLKDFLVKFLLLFLLIAYSSFVKAGAMRDVLNTLENLTCETKGIGNLIRNNDTHTCAPFVKPEFANIISPGLYANMYLRLAINDNEIFPDHCSRANRIDYNDQKISFALCNNIKLQGKRLEAIPKVAEAMVLSFFRNEDPWPAIADAWTLSKSDYYEIHRDKRENDEGTMIDVGIPVPWKIMRVNDAMCVGTKAFNGWLPVGCQYIKEPYPISIYSDFMDLSNTGTPTNMLAQTTSFSSCTATGNCYKRAYSNSRTAIVMSGPIIECITEMMAKLMVDNTVCSFDDVKNILNSSSRTSSALFVFQTRMYTIVSALLTLYVMFFGFRILLSGGVTSKTEVANFVIKFLFVTYFSVGINTDINGSATGRMDGMIQWVLPFLIDGMNQLSSWIINASPSELCKFSDVQYPDQVRHLQLWDSLDCKVTHYLGLDALHSVMVNNASKYHNFSTGNSFNYPIPPYVYLLVPAAISGNFQLISLALMYPILVISVAAFLVSSTVVCLICIVILGMLAPVFVPMYLFNYTKNYFESWARLMFSFMLQPMIVVTFITTMFAVYDMGFYGTCKYTFKEFSYGGVSGSISQTSVGMNATSMNSITANRSVRHYFVDKDWTRYADQKEIDGCKNSLGYMLNNVFQFFASSPTSTPSTVIDTIKDPQKIRDKFDFLSSIKPSPGMFFEMIEVIFQKIKNMVIALLTACFILYLMYHFSAQLSSFAVDMVDGVVTDSMNSLKPQSVFKAGMAALSAAGGAAGEKQGEVARPEAQDKISAGGTGGEEADDKVSAEGTGGGDDSSNRSAVKPSDSSGSSDNKGANSSRQNVGGGSQASQADSSTNSPSGAKNNSGNLQNSSKNEKPSVVEKASKESLSPKKLDRGSNE